MNKNSFIQNVKKRSESDGIFSKPTWVLNLLSALLNDKISENKSTLLAPPQKEELPFATKHESGESTGHSSR
jgi:hypothetical protein